MMMNTRRVQAADMAKKNSRAGTMMLILVAAAGGTIGGWLAFASTTPADNSRVAAAPAAPFAAQPAVLPTLVPIDDVLAASQSVAVQPQAQAARPQPQVLRSVTIPQPPMAMSRSSR
jgi:hypothetical protein